MELYLGLGIDEAIRAAGEPNRGFVVADTLAGEHEAWLPPPEQNGAGQDLSPVSAYSCDQQRIEPILAERAEALGAQLYFATRVDTLTDHGDHVSARLAGPGGPPLVHARYAIAADGARAACRAQLGIGRHGQAVPGTVVSALFLADLRPALGQRRVDALLARAAGAFLFGRGNERDTVGHRNPHRLGRAEAPPQSLRKPLVQHVPRVKAEAPAYQESHAGAVEPLAGQQRRYPCDRAAGSRHLVCSRVVSAHTGVTAAGSTFFAAVSTPNRLSSSIQWAMIELADPEGVRIPRDTSADAITERSNPLF